MNMYEAVVIGAGPAGSTAAYVLAKRGLKTLLLEKYKFPRHKSCAAGISVYTKNLLKELGLYSDKIILHETTKAKLTFVRYNKTYEMKSLIATSTRELFDEYLAKQAERAGAELHEEEPAYKISVGKNYVEVYTKKSTYKCKACIIACGVPEKLSSYAGIKTVYGKALAFEFDAPLSEDYDLDYTLFYYALEKDYAGYFWIFPKKDFANYGVGSWLNTIVQLKKKYGYLQKWVEAAMKTLGYWDKIPEVEKYLKEIRGAIVPVYTEAKPENMIADRVLVIGDSAGLVRHTGEGICFAIESGKLAAEAIADLFEEDKLDKESLIKYYGAKIERNILSELKYTTRIADALTYCTGVVIDLLDKEPKAVELLGKTLEHSILDNVYYEETKKLLKKHPFLLMKMLKMYLRRRKY